MQSLQPQRSTVILHAAQPALRCKSCAKASLGVADPDLVRRPLQPHKIASHAHTTTRLPRASSSTRPRLYSCLYHHLVLFVFVSLMSRFNHPCITTPACIPSPSHLDLRLAPFSHPTPSVPYILISRSHNIHTPISSPLPFTLSPFCFASRSTLPSSHPSCSNPLSPLPPLGRSPSYPLGRSYTERNLFYASMMLSNISSASLYTLSPVSSIRHPIYLYCRIQLFWF